MQMHQIRLEEMLFDVFQAVLVHAQHLHLANGIDLWRTDIDLHMGVAYTFYLLDLKGFRHVLAVTDGENDGMTFLGQSIDHSDAEVAQGRVVGSGEPA